MPKPNENPETRFTHIKNRLSEITEKEVATKVARELIQLCELRPSFIEELPTTLGQFRFKTGKDLSDKPMIIVYFNNEILTYEQ